jgi:hypothetical protein
MESTNQEDLKITNIRKIFRLNPVLIEIGSEQDYLEYIKTVFPESQEKGIFWHGSPNQKFDTFDKDKIGQLDNGYYGQGFYFTNEIRLANRYRISKERVVTGQGSIYGCLLNFRNPIRWNNGYRYFMPEIYMKLPVPPVNQFTREVEIEILKRYNSEWGENKKRLSREDFEYADELGRLSVTGTKYLIENNYDGSIARNPVSRLTEFAVFNTEQIHILGNAKDVEKFKEFMKNRKEK